MARTLTPTPDADSLLALARRDPDAARAALDALPPRAQAALVCTAPHADRGDLIDLLERPERVIPLLPAAEVCFTARAIGLADAGTLLVHATLAQVRTAVDLDAWRGDAPDRASLGDWLLALADAGEENLLRALEGLDRELVVLWLRDAADISVRETDDFHAPHGAMTMDGVFYLVPRRDGDYLELVMTALRVVYEADPVFYRALLYGAMSESDADCEEFALRWRTGRLADLGFPAREEALRAFGYVRREDRAKLDPAAAAPAARATSRALAVFPFTGEHAIFQAARTLPAPARDAFGRRFLALANQVAVASGLPLGDPASIPRAMERAAETASRGLAHVASARGLAPDEVLRRVSLERLHRVGASLAVDVKAAGPARATRAARTTRGA